jgi:hypothetical protein
MGDVRVVGVNVNERGPDVRYGHRAPVALEVLGPTDAGRPVQIEASKDRLDRGVRKHSWRKLRRRSIGLFGTSLPPMSIRTHRLSACSSRAVESTKNPGASGR